MNTVIVTGALPTMSLLTDCGRLCAEALVLADEPGGVCGVPHPMLAVVALGQQLEGPVEERVEEVLLARL